MSRTQQWADQADARDRAAVTARAISTHHRTCATCQRGGRLAVTRHGISRVPCETEALLFTRLAREAEAGWPAS